MVIDNIGIGIEGKVKKWLLENNLAHVGNTPSFRRGPINEYGISLKGRQIQITLNIPSVVLKSRALSDIELENYRLVFAAGSNVTIISELSDSELYLDCKDLAQNMLSNCLGKSKEEQFNWINGDWSVMNKLHWMEKDYVKDSAPYIHRMSINPTKKDIDSLFEEVRGSKGGGIAGRLEYLIHAKPEIGAFYQEVLARAKT